MDTSARLTVENILHEKRAALASVEQQRQELLIEIRTLEGVIALLPRAPKSSAETEDKASLDKRARWPTAAWMTILKLASGQGTQPFGYDDLALAAEMEKVEIKTATLRARMMDYVNAGAVTRVGSGKFLLDRKAWASQEPLQQAFQELRETFSPANSEAVADEEDVIG